jgi:Gpi18-like mannosyltransferase
MSEQRREEWRWTPNQTDLFPGPPPGAFLAPTVRWDANYYVTLARTGYPYPHDSAPVYHVAFFPLYPLAIRAVTQVVGDSFWSAFLISNISALLAGLVILRLGAVNARPRHGLRAALLLLGSPGAHFFSYPYPEALFVLLVSLGLLAVSLERPLLAVIPGALATATRSAGVVIPLALLVAAWKARRDLDAMALRLVAAVAAFGGLLGFALFCSVHFHDPLAFAHIQSHFARSLHLTGPFRALINLTVDPDYFVITLAAIAICIWMIRSSPGWLSLSAWFLLLLPMATGTLKAMIRFQAANVPLLTGTARWCNGKRFRVLLFLAVVTMAFEAVLYGAGVGHY